MADKRISQLVERVTIANNDVLPIVASGATTTNKVTVSTLQDWMQNNLDVGVTSIGITIGSSGTDINVTGSPVTTSGNITINIPTASATNRGLLSSSDWTTFNNKLSSVGLTMPSAFTVTNSPLTSNGTIAVTGAGTVSQYIRGDGSLADFPEAGGGGASVSYYLNGSVSQGTIGGVAYYEMNKTPILGAGTDFTIAADGYIASFITDSSDPSLLEIPGGNWNFESYFQASSGGGSPSFYIELYKVNSGGTATLIASNSANPELIAFGTTTTAYFSTLAVPTTTLALTDRLAVRFYVTHAGRTITMHTENSNLCQVITTFTTGLTALNGLTAQVQNFATGTSGTDFAISSVGSTHTFNLPDASASARGVVSTNSQVFTGVKTFSNGLSLPAVGGTNQNTRLVNIGTIHEGSAGSNQIGFNNSNNIYFGKGLSDGGVITWSNSEVRSYTLPNVSGVIALTTNIPANPVGGSGTINQIPKYTSSTTTIGNSNISDNGSDVVISSRTGISLSGQSILITPNLGGTTNRIETTGSLPLAIATSGASITLAAGGTTPQITLASTGAVTLTGALNGTSASFNTTNAITLTASDSRIRGGDTTGRLLLANSGTTTYGIFHGSSHATLPNAIQFYNDNTLSLTLSSTGAATFSSTIQAGGEITTGSVSRAFLRQTAGGDAELGCKTGGSTTIFSNGTSALSIATTGAATFSSSVTATNHFSTGGSTFATSSGQVGIGTSSFAGDEVLMVSMNGTTNTQAINVKDRNAAASSSTYMVFRKSDDTFQGNIRRSGTDNALYVGGNEYISFGTGGNTERMRITSTGNVGIGTSSPATYGGWGGLDVRGNNGGHIIVANTGGTQRGEIFTDGNGFSVSAQTNIAMLFKTNDTERMRITSGGNIDMGTQIAGAAERLRVVGVISGSAQYGIFTELNSTLYNGFVARFYNTATSSVVGSITQGVSTTSFNTSSDYRLKENVKPVEGALSKLEKLKPCTFNFIADPEKEVMGFLAHEVQEVIPQAVHGEKDEVEIKQVEVSPAELDEEGNVITEAVIEEKEVPVYQGIDHSKLVPLLVASIQELKAEIEALKSQING